MTLNIACLKQHMAFGCIEICCMSSCKHGLRPKQDTILKSILYKSIVVALPYSLALFFIDKQRDYFSFFY